MSPATATLPELNFCRGGTLGLTRRHWTEAPAWADDRVKKIEVSLGSNPLLTFHVRKFIPSDGDVLHRSWVDSDGGRKKAPLAPYAIADVAETRRYIEAYIRDNYAAVSLSVRTDNDVVAAVYAEARAYYKTLRAAAASGELHEQYKLMDTYLGVWFTIQSGMRSAWISGEETLGMSPIQYPAYSPESRVSVPRQVVETVGCILEEVVKEDQREFLVLLATLFERQDRESFYAIFIVVFVALHECEDISKDRYRYARENFKQTRFDQPDYIKRLHSNTNVLLDHWHKYVQRQGVNFSSHEAADRSLSFLPSEKHNLILMYYDAAQHVGPPTLGETGWKEDFWFLAQIAESNWVPRVGYDVRNDGQFDAAAENAAWGRKGGE